jgi:hypothetical protein
VGTKSELLNAMMAAGWHLADKKTLGTSLKMIRSVLLNEIYLTAPFSKLYLFGRGQDFGFQRPVEGEKTHRHHVRFWSCHLEGPEEFHKDIKFWHRFQKPPKGQKGRQLWIGCASKDVGIAPITHNLQITHMIDPNTDSERELIVSNIKHAGFLSKRRNERVGGPMHLKNRAFRGYLKTDGMIAICYLKPTKT